VTLRRSSAALAGFALLAQLSSGCCNPRPLFGRLGCGPVFNRPLFASGPLLASPASAAVDYGGHPGYPVGVPVGMPAGTPGCAGCGAGPVGAAPGGYPHDAYAHAAPPGPMMAGAPPFTGYPSMVSPPVPLGGPVVGGGSTQLPPPQVMPKP